MAKREHPIISHIAKQTFNQYIVSSPDILTSTSAGTVSLVDRVDVYKVFPSLKEPLSEDAIEKLQFRMLVNKALQQQLIDKEGNPIDN